MLFHSWVMFLDEQLQNESQKEYGTILGTSKLCQSFCIRHLFMVPEPGFHFGSVFDLELQQQSHPRAALSSRMNRLHFFE